MCIASESNDKLIVCTNRSCYFAATVSAEERKRQQAIDELINTEQTYVDDMVVALEVGNFSVNRVKYLPYARISELTFLPSD